MKTALKKKNKLCKFSSLVTHFCYSKYFKQLSLNSKLSINYISCIEIASSLSTSIHTWYLFQHISKTLLVHTSF